MIAPNPVPLAPVPLTIVCVEVCAHPLRKANLIGLGRTIGKQLVQSLDCVTQSPTCSETSWEVFKRFFAIGGLSVAGSPKQSFHEQLMKNNSGEGKRAWEAGVP